MFSQPRVGLAALVDAQVRELDAVISRFSS